MAKRIVTKSGKDNDGDITKLCRSGYDWSPRLKADAIRDIENGHHEYWAKGGDKPETQIIVVVENGGKYLRTKPDGVAINKLDNLPDC